MTDTATAGMKLRDQEDGTNNALWGGYTDTNMAVIDRYVTGYQSKTITGDVTVTFTDYSASNDYMVHSVKLTGPSGDGTLTAAATITMPAVRWRCTVYNRTGQTITFDTVLGSSVAVPNGAIMNLVCDATDILDRTPNYTTLYQDPLVDNGALVTKKTLQDAIAAASGLTAPFILNSASDTTPGYLGAKTSGSKAVTASTSSPGGNEVRDFSVEWAALQNGGRKTASFDAAGNSKYVVVWASNGTVTLPAAPSDGDQIRLAVFFSAFTTSINPNGKKVNGSTATLELGLINETFDLTYDATQGDWT